MIKTNGKSKIRSQRPGRIFISLVLLLIFSFISCGKKGPLKLEPRKLPVKIRDLQIQQIGNNIKLIWNYPTLLSDKKTRMERKKVSKIRIYYASKQLSPKQFKKKSTLLMKLDHKKIETENNMFNVFIPFKTKNLDRKLHGFAIKYTYERKKSPLSIIATIQSVMPAKPITDLTIKKENKVIKLKWTRPALNMSNKPIQYITGYRVYKRIQKGPFLLANKESVLQEFYEDMDTGKDGEYFYRVSAIMSKEIESDVSNTVSVKVKDIFPPDPPANLISFKTEDHIFLTWNPVEDKDLDFYKVFRKSDPEAEFKLIVDRLNQNFYKDIGLKQGNTYIYTVSAVDLKGNESQISNVVQEDL
jgi:predicted small lipoprotein YifL